MEATPFDQEYRGPSRLECGRPHQTIQCLAEGRGVIQSSNRLRQTRSLGQRLTEPANLILEREYFEQPFVQLISNTPRILACGIGSLTGALKGDRAGAEAGTQKILAETKRVKLVNMLTATTDDVEKRVKEGFLAILAQGQNPDEAIKIGRGLARR